MTDSKRGGNRDDEKELTATATQLNPKPIADRLVSIAELLRSNRAFWKSGALMLHPTVDGVRIEGNLELTTTAPDWEAHPVEVLADIAARTGTPFDPITLAQLRAECDAPVDFEVVIVEGMPRGDVCLTVPPRVAKIEFMTGLEIKRTTRKTGDGLPIFEVSDGR